MSGAATPISNRQPTMNAELNSTEAWDSCPAGTLNACAHKLKGRRRRRAMTRAIGMALIGICVVGLGAWQLSRESTEQGHYLGGVWCGEVRANARGFAKGSLSPVLAAKIETHLQECPDCRRFMQEMRRSQVSIRGEHARPIPCERCLPSQSPDSPVGLLIAVLADQRP
jgi:hypothetical protein